MMAVFSVLCRNIGFMRNFEKSLPILQFKELRAVRVAQW
jgi:hypothetical protein